MAVNGVPPSTSELRKNPPLRPSITLPPRAPVEGLFNGGSGFSPGPMTLVSSFFSDSEECKSFSQLLAGAMASPTGDASSSGGENGFNQNKPLGLVVAPQQQPPMFMVPHGLSSRGLLDSPRLFSPSQGPFGMTHQQALAQVTAQARSSMHIPSGYTSSFPAPPLTSMAQVPSFITSATGDLQITSLLPESRVTLKESSEFSHSDQMSQPSTVTVDKPADDGYNWRKYGQKHVKDSEFPRSYYKCTHANCPVKKKVERSLDGQITEIIYKGRHNHPPPQPSKRAKDAGFLNGNSSNQGHHDQAATLSKMSKKDHESSQTTTENLSGAIDSDDIGDAETGVDQTDEDEPDAKRQNLGARVPESSSSHRTVTEPRIIVQTTSEVNLLDDGYRWRKYGQKVVKGNPYPRSYYKCTTQGCNVRKHIERCSTDPKDVMTTYEGRHNHDVPAPRSSSHSTASASHLKPQNASTEKHASMDEIYLRSNNHQEVPHLRLKEEKIT